MHTVASFASLFGYIFAKCKSNNRFVCCRGCHSSTIEEEENTTVTTTTNNKTKIGRSNQARFESSQVYTSTNNQITPHPHPNPPPSKRTYTKNKERKLMLYLSGLHVVTWVTLYLSLCIYAAAVILFHHNYPLRASKAISSFSQEGGRDLKNVCNVLRNRVPRSTVG